MVVCVHVHALFTMQNVTKKNTVFKKAEKVLPNHDSECDCSRFS